MNTISCILALLLSFAIPAHAEQFGLFTYEVTDGKITITDYDAYATGPVEIPAEIAGLPVTTIGRNAFHQCYRLSSITIPDSVTSIGDNAFSGCTGLTSTTIPESVTYIHDGAFRNCTGLLAIDVDPHNPNYSSLDGVLFNKDKTSLIQYPAARSGRYDIPDSVTSVESRTSDYFGEYPRGQGAFEGSSELTGVSIPSGVTSIGADTFKGCSSLPTVTIPANVTSIGYQNYSSGDISSHFSGAFEDCTSLHSAIFLGDAPTTFDEDTFANTAPGFTIYYLSCSSGFTSPTWNGYPAVRIDERACPAAPWLVSHDLPYDTDLNQDLNGDGVSLLMAYALGLDPHANLSGRMPAPVVSGESLSLSFSAAAPGITYTAKTSTDLQSWTTEGVTISDLDPTKHRTASVARDVPQCYLRLVVSESL